jgi:hypothetical protein
MSRIRALAAGLAVLVATGTICYSAAAAPSESASTAASAGVERLHTVNVGGVSLDVPTSWTVSHTDHPGCIVAPGHSVPAGESVFGVDDCQLRVVSGAQLGDRFRSVDEFYYGGPGDTAQCIRGDQARGWATVAADAAKIGPADAEYRRFTHACVSRPAEQWFLAGPPAVLIQRTSADPTTEGAARRAVDTARVPARSIGYPRSYTGAVESASGSSVVLEPARLTYDELNRPSASYVLDQSTRFDVAHATIDYQDADYDVQRLTLAQFEYDAVHGFPNLGSGAIPVAIAQSVHGAQVDSLTVFPARAPR